jgi:hypothetical protein
MSKPVVLCAFDFYANSLQHICLILLIGKRTIDLVLGVALNLLACLSARHLLGLRIALSCLVAQCMALVKGEFATRKAVRLASHSDSVVTRARSIYSHRHSSYSSPKKSTPT